MRILTADEIVQLRIQSLNLTFDSFKVDTTFEQLNNDAIERFVILIKEARKYKPSNNIEVDLMKLGFLQPDKTLTRAAELLFGTHYTAIHLGRFKSPVTIIDDIVIRAPLIIAVQEAMDFIKKNILLE